MYCSSCKRNNAQKELACGYLPESERGSMVYIPPEYNDLTIRDNVCPVYTYLENVYAYQYINVASKLLATQLSFPGRIAVEVYNNYMGLKKK